MNGWLLLDKSEGVSSAGALNIIKKLFKLLGYKKLKLGHAGTLDPFASGLLVVAIGEATKLISYIMDQSKDYEFSIKWGENRDTLDREGKITQTSERIPHQDEIKKSLSKFIGNIMQIPPEFSALKIKGQRAYTLARNGEEVILNPREVVVHDLQFTKHTDNVSEFFLSCGKGFYVRSLARDIAQELNACGYVLSLRRVKSKKFNIGDAISLDKIKKVLHNGEHVSSLQWVQGLVKPIISVLDDILVQNLSDNDAQKILCGNAIPSIENFLENSEIAALYQSRLLAICVFQNGWLKPKRVFNL